MASSHSTAPPRPRIGSLFSGYGGLDMGVQSVLGGSIAWHSDIDKGACKILAHRYPDVPNLGDITAVDWSRVEPVDILTGGSPCQDLSHAGARKGMTEGTRSNLWVAMREAIAQLRPGLVVWENVRGAGSAEATSDLEFCPGCMGDPWYRGTTLRALGRVVGDLADLGYVGRVRGLRAADVGAPHGRFRYFLAATDAQHPQLEGARQLPRLRRGHDPRPDVRVPGVRLDLLPTPRATDGTKGGPNQRGSSGDLMLPSAVALLPTPAVNDMGEGKTPDAWDAWTDDMQARHGNGNGHGKSLAIEAQRLLPTPRASDGPEPNCHGRTWSGTDNNLHNVARKDQWGDYAAAIARWEHVLGRPAPAPTQSGRVRHVCGGDESCVCVGNPQLSPAFVEWLMGLPAGWVTDVPGITRNEALKALGNGVVSQQCAAALRTMLAWEVAA